MQLLIFYYLIFSSGGFLRVNKESQVNLKGEKQKKSVEHAGQKQQV